MDHGKHRRRGVRRLLPLALLVVFAATAVLSLRDHAAAVRAHGDTRDAALRLAESRLADAVARGIVAVDGMASLFVASERVEPDEFADYVEHLSEQGQFLPGVTTFGWAVPLSPEDVATFERDVLGAMPRRLRAADEVLVQPPLTTDGVVLQYGHRLDGTPSDAQGFDLASQDDRRLALETARDTGDVAVTAPLELVSGNTGLLVVRAVYDGSPTDVADRRSSLQGFAIMPIVSSGFLASVLTDDRITVDLVDSEAGRSVIDAGPGVTDALADRSDARSTSIAVAGRTWTLTATPTTPAPQPFALGALPGRLLPLLLVGGIFVLIERERRERVRQLEAAAEAEREAAALGRELATTQRRLLSTVSHELRTPLTAIIGFTSLLNDALEHDKPELRGFGRRIAVNAAVLKELVEDLLAFSRLERGEFTVLPQEQELAALTRTTLDAIGPILRGHEVRFHGDRVDAVVDTTAFRRIVTNLVENAVRYGGDEPVDVWLTADQRAAVLHVDDGGDGVPVDERERIFGRFQRGSTGLAVNSGGTGLGLSVVRGLAEIMGGTATVGDAPTGGARFTVRLPRRVEPRDDGVHHDRQLQET